MGFELETFRVQEEQRKTQWTSALLSGVWNSDVAVAVSNPHSEEKKLRISLLFPQNIT